MIQVNGTLRVKADFVIELDITEDQYDSLSEGQQNSLIMNKLDMYETLRQGETDEIEVWDVNEINSTT